MGFINPETGQNASSPFVGSSGSIASLANYLDPSGYGSFQPLSYAPPATSGGGGSYSGGGGSSVDAATLAQYDQGIQNTRAAIGRLPAQLVSGNQAIDVSYNDALKQLLAARNQAEGTYNTNKQQTAQDYVTGKNTVRSNAGVSLNSLRRILGIRGAGGSSAYGLVAPQAVARDATIQQGDLGQTFGRNNQALDTNWGNYMLDYKNQRSNAASQRVNQRGELQRSINTTKASLLQSLATLLGQKSALQGGNAKAASQPSLNTANRLLNSVSVYRTRPISYTTKAYATPNLSKYTVNPNAAPQYNGQSQGNDYVSPYLAALLGKKQPQGA